MRPDNNPYSWYEDGKGYGIIADIFAETAQNLSLDYELVPVSSITEYEEHCLLHETASFIKDFKRVCETFTDPFSLS